MTGVLANGGDGGSPIRARFQALKDELKHPVLSMSEAYGVQGGHPYASMAAFDRAKEVLSVMRELKGLLSKLSPLPNATSSAHFMVSHGNERVGSSRFRSKEEGDKAIHSPHWKQLWGNLVSVNWAKFQKRSSKNRVTSKGRFAKNKNHAKWKWVPKRSPDVDISLVRDGLDEANATLKLQNVADDGLENTQAKKAADGLGNIEQHRFEKVNLEGDQEVCFEASKVISMPIETAKTHPTYVGKLTTQKKSYRDYAMSDSSTNGIEEPTHSIGRRQPILSTTEKISNILKNRYKGLPSRTPLPYGSCSRKLRGRQTAGCLCRRGSSYQEDYEGFEEENEQPTLMIFSRVH
ncbi:hypothetical protein Cgig2_030740 [Carnegiea gigantea]|uniref:Uncharacterized protein n=1 Tax=Carnegiea gigantea TaxID=171969 RepID=A0A9Q1KTZ3_9CARY|nr:hypothetical protein Cgig2_030740 [Carnegiea gigantea]